MRKTRRIVYLALILLMGQVSKQTLSGTRGMENSLLEEFFIPKESSKELNSENPMMSLGLFFNLLKAV